MDFSTYPLSARNTASKSDPLARPADAKKAAGDFALAMDKVPILAVTEGGVTTKFGQSKAIERFAAKRFGLFGENDLEGARIDMICEHVRDIKDACARAAQPFSIREREIPTGGSELAKEHWACTGTCFRPET